MRRCEFIVAVAALGTVAVNMQRSFAGHGLPHPVLLARGLFMDHV